MTKRMLIDATHAEETRVVVLDGNRLEDFDVETSTKRQLKGNIYLAKVVRVEPSLQACFVEYGGNRHGFLAFSEIHPDYYQIPVADRQRLVELEAEEARREEEEADRAAGLAQPAASEFAAAETADESGVTAEVWDEPAQTEAAMPDFIPPASAEIAAEAGDESGATAEVLAEAPDAAMAAHADAGDIPGPWASDAAPDADRAAQPAEQPHTEADAPALSASADMDPPGGAAIGHPDAHADLDAAPPPLASSTEPAPGGAPPPSPPIASSSVQDEEPDPQSHRAQPLIIEQETVSEPVEADEHHAEADTETWTADDQPDVALRRGSDEGDLTDDDVVPESPPPETVGGEPDSAEEHRERRIPPRFLRNYKIQEVIRRRQILLVQVVKEERGTKGAALTTYLSLAGRFCVLMPNSPRGGGISRKITSATDRRRLKEVIAELDMPKGMGLIVRTAGANRPKPEIKRDCEYLLRLWDDIREHTLKSVAPALIYEEASLIKRAIRDVYSRDIDEIIVDGEEGWRQAHEFMRMLMPSHAKKVQLWRDQSQPLFARYQVEAQLDAMLQPTVQLRSGGYLVINQAEALVAIDVNSGRSTRERNVEETALRTNLEAADEVARQLRLRDLAGLIVIDFIDMESKKHNAMVERRIKDALKNDRARIQVGHISHFGLLEMSRQRLRPSLAETSFILCPHCGGTGHVRSTESGAIHVLRGIEEEGSKRRAAEIVVHVATPTALYILNHKRDRLREIESRYGMRVTVLGDDTQMASQFRIDRIRAQATREGVPAAITPDQPPSPPPPVIEAEDEEEVTAEEEPDVVEAAGTKTDAEEAQADAETEAEGGSETGDAADRRRRRRRRRRGGRRDETAATEPPVVTDEPPPEAPEAIRTTQSEAGPEDVPAAHIEGVPEFSDSASEEDRSRRRGRRGGRRRRRDGEGEASPFAMPGAEQPDLAPVYVGPTPANPFGGQAFDIFDVLEQAEANAAVARQGPPQPMVQQFEPEPGVPTAAVAAEPATAEASAGPAGQPETAAAVPVAAAAEIANASGPEPARETVLADTVEAAADAAVVDSAAEETGAGADAIPSSAGPLEPAAERDAAMPAAASPEPAAEAPEHAPAATALEAVAAPAPSTPEVANDVAPEAAVRPIIIGGEEQSTEKKRGWWRR